jgi:hypothetical protein
MFIFGCACGSIIIGLTVLIAFLAPPMEADPNNPDYTIDNIGEIHDPDY